ncbi:hypothetical protein Cni_G07465 [Canna indica]|uniref:DUF7787 domain-containing protein n=1 Tax=Canna indica TaxID=4628 RepID=A0AAQ3Q5R7_9LILI|nr:hypothetical protein Cni_G07465 [Canna indica]
MFKYLGRLLSWKSKGGRDLLCRVCLISALASALFTNKHHLHCAHRVCPQARVPAQAPCQAVPPRARLQLQHRQCWKEERERERETMEKANERILLEQYIHLYFDPWRSFPSLAHLKQIIVMHGLRQQYNRPKMHIIEGLTFIELMSPLRSTLEESIHSQAFLMANEIGADLANLGW